MKIALAQMRVIPGDPDKNFATIRQFVNGAKDAGCSIIAFPEMCVGGYLLGDRWTEEKWCEYCMSYNDKIGAISQDITIIYGNIYVDKSRPNKDGRSRKYNAAYVYQNGKLVEHGGNLPHAVAIKSLLPNYRIFDDERYFFSLQEYAWDAGVMLEELLVPFELTIEDQKVRIGVEICEDLWFTDYRYNEKPLNVTGMLTANGAQMIFNLSSSPWTYGKDWARNNRIKDILKHSDRFVPFFYVNCVGVQNNGKNIVTFDGDSTVYNKKAEVVQTANSPYAQELIVHDTVNDNSIIHKKVVSRISSKYLAITEGIKGMDQISGNSTAPYIVGLSGGIDSAVVAALLCRSVGPQRVITVNLPSQYNSAKTRNIAANIATKLGVTLHVIPIQEIAELNRLILEPFQPTDFNYENIQAKIRGTAVLSNIAGILNGFMTCNGNKVEIALGYSTLYGDVNGAIAPIGDLLKTEVFEMAHYLNSEIFNDEVIPGALIPDHNYNFDMPPSAELKHNQVDPMKWGYHDAIIEAFTDYRKISPETILMWYRDDTLCKNLGIPETLFELYKLGNPELFIQDIEWVIKNVQRMVYKRIQSPPIIILSKGSYGYDIRESQLPPFFSDDYFRLRKQILGN